MRVEFYRQGDQAPFKVDNVHAEFTSDASHDDRLEQIEIRLAKLEGKRTQPTTGVDIINQQTFNGA